MCWNECIRPILRRRGRPPPIIYTPIDRRMNALQLCRWRFSHRNFVAIFFQAKCDFTRKTAILRFWALSGGLRATYDVYLRLIGNGKHVVDFLLVYWAFLPGAIAEALRANIDWKSAISLQGGSVLPKISDRRGRLHNRSSSPKTRLNDLSYGIKIWTYLYPVL